MNFWTEALLAVFITYAIRQLHLSAAAVGVVHGVANLGYLAGSMLVPWLNRRLGMGTTIAWAYCCRNLLAALAPPAPRCPGLRRGSWWRGRPAHLERRRRQPAPDHRARSDAGPDERHEPFPDLGHHAVRRTGWLAAYFGLQATVVVAAVAIPFATIAVLLSAVRPLRALPTALAEPVAPE